VLMSLTRGMVCVESIGQPPKNASPGSSNGLRTVERNWGTSRLSPNYLSRITPELLSPKERVKARAPAFVVRSSCTASSSAGPAKSTILSCLIHPTRSNPSNVQCRVSKRADSIQTAITRNATVRLTSHLKAARQAVLDTTIFAGNISQKSWKNPNSPHEFLSH
jgi:hypothetical protein